MPPRVRKKSKGFSLGGGGSIKPADIALFTRQMATMMRAGVPLVQAFDIVAEGSTSRSSADLIRNIRNDVAGGSAFASSLRKHPLYFDDLFCNLVDAGEQSGALETMLDRIATYKEKTESLKAKVRKAMTYPIGRTGGGVRGVGHPAHQGRTSVRGRIRRVSVPNCPHSPSSS